MKAWSLPTLLARCGFALLGAGFVVSVIVALGHSRRQVSAGEHVLRFSHFNLEAGLRETYADIFRDYEALQRAAGRRVRIEQMAVPARAYPAWLRTQLIGDTAPDLMMVSRYHGMEETLLARHFSPITGEVAQPNPYNAGTPAEGQPWRDTFHDALHFTGYDPLLMEIYATPLTTNTVRIYYNRELARRILGSDPTPPRTYREFLAWCEATRRFAAQEDRPIAPIAGSLYNAQFLFGPLFSTQTQRLRGKLDARGDGVAHDLDVTLAALRGEWSLESTPVAHALALTREVGATMQPGFRQLGRDDAVFLFAQGRALMIATGSWAAPSLRTHSDFPLGVFTFPVPMADDPQYGAGVKGPSSETENLVFEGVAVSSRTTERELAIDFLRYLTSVPVATRFSRQTHLLSAVKAALVEEELAPFVPRHEGYTFGLSLSGLGDNTRQLTEQEGHLLHGPAGSVAAFVAAVQPGYAAALRADLARWRFNSLKSLMRQDVVFAAQSALAAQGEPGAARKAAQLLETQIQNELLLYWTDAELGRIESEPGR